MKYTLHRFALRVLFSCLAFVVEPGEAQQLPPRGGFGEPFLDPDPVDCYLPPGCPGRRDCPVQPSFCADATDPEFHFDPTFKDPDVRFGPSGLTPDYVPPRGNSLDFWPSNRTAPFQISVAELPRPGITLLERGGRSYLEFLIGRLRIRVINNKSPKFGPSDPPADVTLRIQGVPLDKVEFVKTIGLSSGSTREPVLERVQVFHAGQAGTAAGPLAQQGLGLIAPGWDTCEAQAILQFAQGTYNGLLVFDMPPVRFPPIVSSNYSNCSDAECIQIYLAWIRAHHNIWRARQMLDLVAALPSSEQRAYAWGRPGRDWQGEKVTLRTSPEHWFGGYSGDALDQTRTVVSKLWQRFLTNEVGTLDLDLRCPTSSGNVCATTDGVIAHHIVVGQVDFCNLFFTLGDACYGGEVNEEEHTCGGFIVPSDWRRAEVVAHEVLHHTTVNSVYVQDKHSHGHGSTCLKDIKILQSMYEYDNVRHLATVSNCIHNWLGRHNNDTYAFFITTIGDMVYRGEMKTWPAWADPTPQPPQNCTVGAEGCYCRTVNPAFDAPDGDYRNDQWCEDNDGEMTCQKTKFNASDTVGICTKCDAFRGGGCECDGNRPCDKGSCWGDLTANGQQTVGHCYDFPPPAWACLADCKHLYNSPVGRCYYDHPSGKARCIDGLICEEIEEFNCYQQGKVCFDGACITECVTTQNCRYDGEPQELDLDYPEYFVCSQNLSCEAQPALNK